MKKHESSEVRSAFIPSCISRLIGVEATRRSAKEKKEMAAYLMGSHLFFEDIRRCKLRKTQRLILTPRQLFRLPIEEGIAEFQSFPQWQNIKNH
ncbi:hypothetical protein [Paenibacillus sp. DMB20]|uniref:hypothetical protein n=1 Tax=Paenibacillus sp. DMB20 TaxID=1642570 RepID=UPI00128B51E3|nr:hypothetical protein [Paenibacillus sp. DMB20]